MIIDHSLKLAKEIQKETQKVLSNLPQSFPCQVKSIQEKVFVEVETLLPQNENDIPLIIPIMQSPYLNLPIKEGDIGIALNCSFLFEKALLNEKIEEKLNSIRQNGLFFIPLVSKDSYKGEESKTMLMSQDFSSNITLTKNQIDFKAGDQTKGSLTNSSIELQSNEVKIESATLMELKGSSATLGEILSDLVTALTKMNADPVAGNGAPLASPTLSSEMPQILAKIKGSFN